MRRFLSLPVRVHLLLLVILLALPSITLIVYWGMAERDEAVADAKIECLKFVNAVAGEQQAVVAGVRQLAATLSLLPEVQRRNVPATDALLSDLLKKNPLYANIVISYKSGVLWATGTPAGAPFEGTLSIAGRKYFQDAVRSGAFASGEFSVGRIGNKPVMTFAQPITNTSNELTDVIAISLNLDHIQSLFEKIKLPAGSSFGLLDHRGIILFRNSRDPFSEQLVGKPDSREELFTKMVEGPDEGTYEAMGNDGKVRLTAYRKLRLPHESRPYLYIRSSIPKASIVSKANTAMIGNMAALMSVFAVGLILAVFIGKRMIADPIAKLKEASRQLAAGPAPVNVSGQVKNGELGELAHAFDDMAATLLRKEALQLAAEDALRASEKRLLTVLNSITDGYYALDSEWRFVEMNKVTESHFGHTAAELRGKEIWKLTNTPPDSPLYRQYDRAVRENLPRHFEAESRINPGMWSELHLYPRDGFLDVYFRDITKRKQAETVLQNTLHRFYLMLASMYSGVLLMTDDDRIEFVNQAFCDYYGLKEAPVDLTGLASRELLERIRPAFLHPDEAAARIEEILQRGEPVKGEEFAMRGGRTAMRDFVPLSVHGESCGRLWIHFDITELKRAEEELQKLASVVRHSNEFINVASLEGKMIFINDAGAEMVGLSEEEAEQTNILQVIPEHLQDTVKNEVLPALKEKGLWRGELQYRNLKNGRLTDVYATTFTVKDPDTGEPLFLANTSIDITERKRAEESVERLKALMDHNPSLAFLKDESGRYVYLNNAYVKQFALPKDWYGKTDFDFWPRESAELFRANDAEILRSGQATQYLEDSTDRNGTRYCWLAYKFSFTDSNNNRYVGGIGINVTDRVRAEEALQQANISLEERIRERTMDLQRLTEQLEGSRGDLRKLASELVMAEERERKRIAGVLHDEIAQILATVRMRLDLLGGLPSDQQETLKDAKALLLQSIQETRTLMTDIGNPLLFDMGLKAACESLAKRLMERYAVRIRCEIRDAYKHLNPDVKTILFQVIRELLNNVVKHSGAQNAHVAIDMDNGHFSMKVTDDGAGFDPQMLGAPTVDGGFGLYSIRERLLAIGGSLRIESAPGTGTVVTAVLPAALD